MLVHIISHSLSCLVSERPIDVGSCRHHSFVPNHYNDHQDDNNYLHYTDVITGEHTALAHDFTNDRFVKKMADGRRVHFPCELPYDFDSLFYINKYLGVRPGTAEHLFFISVSQLDADEEGITDETRGPRFLVLTDLPEGGFTARIIETLYRYASSGFSRNGQIMAYWYSDYETPFVDFLDPDTFAVISTHTLINEYKEEEVNLDGISIVGEYVHYNLDESVAVYDPLTSAFVGELNWAGSWPELRTEEVDTQNGAFIYLHKRMDFTSLRGPNSEYPLAYEFRHVELQNLVYTAAVLVSDGYLQTTPTPFGDDNGRDAMRFFGIAKQLPQELQAKLANITNGRDSDVITSQQAEPAFRSWVQSF